MHADDLALIAKNVEDLRAMIKCFLQSLSEAGLESECRKQ